MSSFERYQKQGLTKIPKDDPPKDSDPQGPTSFEAELASLINRHSQENASGTPDFILAAYLTGCLDLFNTTLQQRSNWRGEKVDSIFNVTYDEKVKIAVYDEHGRKNEIGEAQLEVWPGETMTHGKIVEVIATFAEPPTDEQS